MNLITEEVKNFLGNSSMIRRMFEAGIELKKQYGAENVYDFSLGNPDLPPPPEVKTAMEEIAGKSGDMFAFGYMPNAGSVDCREALAKLLKKEQDLNCAKEDIIVTHNQQRRLMRLIEAIIESGTNNKLIEFDDMI